MTSPFYLNEPEPSIFVGLDMRERPTLGMIYGFLENKMGIKLRKKHLHTYADEQTHYENYLRLEDNGYITTHYRHGLKNWGRIQPVNGLSLSIFHRPSRHSFAKENYWDFDMKNCQPQVLYELAKKNNMDTAGLSEYCSDSKGFRIKMAEHFKLTDTVKDGSIMTGKEKAKQLFIRMCFGGEIDTWRKDYNVDMSIPIPKLLTDFEETMKEIAIVIWKNNPHLVADCETDAKFIEKSKKERRNSVVSRFCQTYERLLQETCVAYCCNTIKTVQLFDTIPSQDGFMPLKSQLPEKDISKLLNDFQTIISDKYGLNIVWELKPYDESYDIPISCNPPISITLDDLELGEVYIAKIIKKAFKDTIKYDGRLRVWYVYNQKSGLWNSSGSPPIGMFAERIQHFIMIEKNKMAIQLSNTTDAKTTEDINSKIGILMKHYKKVGGGSYINQLGKYMMEHLRCDGFDKQLDNTVGKFIFADGIYDLKNDKFEKGFKYNDYIMTTLSHSYLGLRPDYEDNKKTVRSALLKILNNNEIDLEYFLSLIGYCFTGESHLQKSLYYCVDGTDNSKGDNGKSFFFSILRSIFPEMIIITDSSFLEERNDSAHKQIAQFTKNYRIVFADEGSQKKLNEERLKKIAEGGELPYKRMFGCEDICKIYFKFICASNHIPKVEEEASYNRYIQIPFSSHFARSGRTEENPDLLQFIADPSLKDKFLSEYVPEIIRLILSYAVKFYKNGLPSVSSNIIKATAATKMKNDSFACWWFDNFEKDDACRVSLDTIVGLSSISRKDTMKELQRIDIGFNSQLEGMGTKKNKDGKDVRVKGGVLGWRIKEREEDDCDGFDIPIATPIL